MATKKTGKNEGEQYSGISTSVERAVFPYTAHRCSEVTFRPVSGLISGVNLKHRLPMQTAQWLMDVSLLIYRCGGSVGFGITLTNFPFNQPVVKPAGT